MRYPPIFSCTESAPGHLMRNKQCTAIKSQDTIVTDEEQSVISVASCTCWKPVWLKR